jgi:hypothetical protein
MIPQLEWFKSSYSSADGPDCVEVAIPPAPNPVHIRDSKSPESPHLKVAPSTWVSFTSAFK